MYAGGLKAGFSTRDLRSMPFGRLANVLASLGPSAGGAGPREATQSDIDALAR